jgi:mitochondrial fission protein ELM1
MDSDSAALRVGIVAHKLAGHVRQCEAILAAIADVRPVDATYLPLRSWSPIRSHHMRRAVLSLPGNGALRFILAGEWRKPFDLIISSGGATITASILLTRRNGARSIHSGLAVGVRPGEIDCILTDQPQHAAAPNHVFGPVPVLRFRPAGERRPLPRLAGSRLGVILGGEARGGGFDFDDDYCTRLFGRLKAFDDAVPGLRWVVVTSRRTPAAGYPPIEAFASTVTSCDFVDYRKSGLGSVARAFSCDAVLVTEDSKSMITEFARNGYPVGVLGVRRTGAVPAHASFDELMASRTLPLIDPTTIDAPLLEAALTAIAIAPEDIYAETRAMIAQRLPEIVTSQA